MYILGQVLGIASTVCTIILPFFKKKWQILALNIAVNLLVASNLALIGQVGSGIFLCLVATCVSSLVRCPLTSFSLFLFSQTYLFGCTGSWLLHAGFL